MKEKCYWYEFSFPVRDVWRLCESEQWVLSREVVFDYSFPSSLEICFQIQCETCRMHGLLYVAAKNTVNISGFLWQKIYLILWRWKKSATTSSFRVERYGCSVNQNSEFWHVKLCSFRFSSFPTSSWNLFRNTVWRAKEAWLNKSWRRKHRYTIIKI